MGSRIQATCALERACVLLHSSFQVHDVEPFVKTGPEFVVVASMIKRCILEDTWNRFSKVEDLRGIWR